VKGAHTLSVRATLRDTDAFGHVNNSVYVNWFEEVRTSYVVSRRNLRSIADVDFILAATTVHFRSPVYLHETIELRCAPIRIGNRSWDLAYEGRAEEGGRLVVEGVSTQVQYDYAVRAPAPIPDAWRGLLTADLELP
jgi:acyl-CoA thioester hydrolase